MGKRKPGQFALLDATGRRNRDETYLAVAQRREKADLLHISPYVACFCDVAQLRFVAVAQEHDAEFFVGLITFARSLIRLRPSTPLTAYREGLDDDSDDMV